MQLILPHLPTMFNWLNLKNGLGHFLSSENKKGKVF